MADAVKRRYHSPLREEQRRRTRRRILDAASQLFLERGYPATTIEAIASGAGVAPDTVYATFTTKRGLLKELMDVAIAGDDEDVAIGEREDVRALHRERDPRRQIAGFVAGMTERLERARPLDDIMRSAAAVDPEVAALRDDLQERQRRGGMRSFVSMLSAGAPMRAGLDRDDATTMVWTLTSPEVHHLLRVDSGWTKERYGRWLEDTLVRTLLRDV